MSKRLIKLYAAFWFVFVIVSVVLQSYLGFPGKVYFEKGRLLGIVYLLLDMSGLSFLVGTPSLWCLVVYVGCGGFHSCGTDALRGC